MRYNCFVMKKTNTFNNHFSVKTITKIAHSILTFLILILISSCGYNEESEFIPPPSLTADFDGEPLLGAQPLTVNFTDHSSGDITSYEWDFNNDGIVDSTTRGNVSNQYTDTGTFSVKLRVTNASGSDERERTEYITVIPGSGLQLWLRADSITGLNDGDPVDEWTDSSGNGNNATQTGGNRPTYRTDIINGRPVVRFNGSTNYLDFTSMNMQPATVFAVVKYELPAVNAPFLGNDTNNSYVGYYDNTIYYYSTVGNMNVANTTPAAFQIITAHAQPPGSNSSIRIDGSPVVSGNYNWGTSTFVFIGRRNTERFEGDIAEVLIYSTNLNSTEIDEVEDYLSSKYTIAIP